MTLLECDITRRFFPDSGFFCISVFVLTPGFVWCTCWVFVTLKVLVTLRFRKLSVSSIDFKIGPKADTHV